ncbi:MAG: hypothetical protein EP344_05225 [Bacteroidetes bacterium]|nr:MAG: hypothetical protein EP344_05225 [Bacteroidota bacterium]
MKKQLPNNQLKMLAMAATVIFFLLMWLYSREFPVYTNTIGAARLVTGAIITGALLATGIIYFFRHRLSPWDRHLPESGSIIAFCLFFSPLFASLLNRASGTVDYRRFTFVSEEPYLASNYGVLKNEDIKPTGYRLIVKDQGEQYRFQYKKQAYYPITQPGEPVLLPVRKGLLGFDIVELE